MARLQDFTPRIHVTASDFASFTQNGALCDEEGQLGPREFEHVMRYHIRHLTQSKLALTASESRSGDDAESMQLSAIKLLLMEQTRAERALTEIKLALGISSGLGGDAVPNTEGPRRLEVTVLGARHLPKKDLFGTIDAFCEVMGDGRSVRMPQPLGIKAFWCSAE